MTEETAEEKLKRLNEERKTLKVQVKDEREKRLEAESANRVDRDAKIEKIKLKLDKVLKAIFEYNKLGKVAKVEYDILGIISKEVNASVD
jgi:predicted Rossmann fold nucleotide-binding protein DprA/Smf involved in DNA uptake